ncbi:hypothetical protein CISG_02678 [Coccidioides immitis RMSCC 3703]|uniref:Uncharacterized protein n=1 Tax=Coccidioides immitis RMSCC 3703 TaxID=454286 RepID=A0A0J8RB79_COCIT|nr:hypothetical protein CISG_02678 [Coccidioides immitis RMSCC 3703]
MTKRYWKSFRSAPVKSIQNYKPSNHPILKNENMRSNLHILGPGSEGIIVCFHRGLDVKAERVAAPVLPSCLISRYVLYPSAIGIEIAGAILFPSKDKWESRKAERVDGNDTSSTKDSFWPLYRVIYGIRDIGLEMQPGRILVNFHYECAKVLPDPGAHMNNLPR